MTDTIYSADNLFVTRFVAPATDGDDDRVRWQFTIPGSEYTTLNRDSMLRLSAALCEDAIPDKST